MANPPQTFPDLLQSLVDYSHKHDSGDKGTETDGPTQPTTKGSSMTPGVLQKLLLGQQDLKEDNPVMDDSGSISTDQSNPFMDAIRKSRAGNNNGTPVLKQLMSSLFSPSSSASSAAPLSGGTVGPTSGDTFSATPSKDQTQTGLQPAQEDGVPLPQERPEAAPTESPYAQPTALDPTSIEQLRLSLQTQAGQMDPNNPNGLSGRMNDPNSQVDQEIQGTQAQDIDNQFRPATTGGVQQPMDTSGQLMPSAAGSDSLPSIAADSGSLPDLTSLLGGIL